MLVNVVLLDRFEQEKVSFFERVRSGFERLHAKNQVRMKRLDATQMPEQVFEAALGYVKRILIIF